MKFIHQSINKNKTGIYQIKNKIDNKSYIGQTKDRFVERFWHHIWLLEHQCHDNLNLQKAWQEDGGDNFEFDVIEIIEDPSLLDDAEKQHIADRKKEGMCFNMSDGGGGRSGVPMSERAKRLVGEKNRIHGLGRKASLSTRQKMSGTHKGRVPNRPNQLGTEKARKIKEMLVAGCDSKAICHELGVDYKKINGIISNDAWHSVKVDGWEEFNEKRKRDSLATRTNPDDVPMIRKLYEEGMSIRKISIKYQKSRQTISNIVNRRTHTNI